MANDSERMRDPMSQPNDEDYARVAELQQPAPKLLSEEELRRIAASHTGLDDAGQLLQHITALTAKLERYETARKVNKLWNLDCF